MDDSTFTIIKQRLGSLETQLRDLKNQNNEILFYMQAQTRTTERLIASIEKLNKNLESTTKSKNNNSSYEK